MQQDLLNFLTNFLGNYKKTSETNVAFICPFCNHPKHKLEINISESSNKQGHWHCWVCNNGGERITSLFYKLQYDKVVINELKKILPKIYVTNNTKQKTIFDNTPITNDLLLFNSFIPLYNNNNSQKYLDNYKSFNFFECTQYLLSRNIDIETIEKYKIHYSINNKYDKRLIIPSYDENFKLNYFVTRDYTETAFIPYKNPKLDKDDVIIFEHLINWNKPIFLVEGMFDAIELNDNTIPLLGKTIGKKLLNRLQYNNTEVNLILDNDAYNESIKLSEILFNHGIENVYVTFLKEKDISEIGKENSIKYIYENRIKVNLFNLIKLKINDT